MKGEQLLHKAVQKFEHGRANYGIPDKYFHRLAKRWSQTLGTEITAAQVIKCMIELKLERLESNPAHFDSIVDIAGYAACLWEVSE